ncbi:hypothetical protein AVEN_7507-1 [Araneus ventricosus]|uniref:Uncharacterized protein n=1 Tax=Araneus ventricosus TaxID=182803 RepID=A0A4Y2QNI9_ARAVE|nr:hypothetical protein AVEN_7507-1 [Araneus ventricosus]
MNESLRRRRFRSLSQIDGNPLELENIIGSPSAKRKRMHFAQIRKLRSSLERVKCNDETISADTKEKKAINLGYPQLVFKLFQLSVMVFSWGHRRRNSWLRFRWGAKMLKPRALTVAKTALSSMGLQPPPELNQNS